MIKTAIRLFLVSSLFSLSLNSASAKEFVQLGSLPNPFEKFTTAPNEPLLFLSNPKSFTVKRESYGSTNVTNQMHEREIIGTWQMNGASFMVIRVTHPMGSFYELIDSFNSFPRKNTFKTPDRAEVLLTDKPEFFIHTSAPGCSGEGDILKYKWTGKKFTQDSSFKTIKSKRWPSSCE